MAKDPYKYFRVEARELLEGLSKGVLALERASAPGDGVVQLLRLAHTLKGASRVVKQAEIAQSAHRAEDVLSALRGAPGPIPRGPVDELLGLLDVIARHVSALEPLAAVPQPAEAFATVRVEVAEVDALLRGVFEVGVGLTALQKDAAAVEGARLLATRLASSKAHPLAEELRVLLERTERRLRVGLEQTVVEAGLIREQASQLRLQPASTLFAGLERAARDAAQSVDKQIEFEASGGENRLDAHVLAAIRDALLHVVRNAVAHGIETPGERAAAAKSAAGRISLKVERRGHQIAFSCSDDGRGVDAEAVRSAAVRQGLLSTAEAAALSREDAVRLILRGGVTTHAAVTQVAGRGVGLDVLRACAVRLKGEITITSVWGRGTTIVVCVPMSMSSLTALGLSAGGATALVPLDAVRQTLRLGKNELAHTADSRSILLGGRVIPFLSLAELLPAVARVARPQTWSVVVIESGGDTVALGVERLTGIHSVVVSPLPRAVDRIAAIAGASLDAEGNPRLVLDPAGLVAAAAGHLVGRHPEVAAVARPPILVIDDSLTTRMLEQSILESAGYEVELACSAEEGMIKARARSYGLFVVDVEMPGMNGFEFVEQTRRDPQLGQVPAILVTSRAAPEDRLRGAQAGASEYIVKAEFDQGRLLRTIRGLIG